MNFPSPLILKAKMEGHIIEQNNPPLKKAKIAGIQLAIEMKDAYAPYWGFSMWDFGTGSVGSFWPRSKNNKG